MGDVAAASLQQQGAKDVAMRMGGRSEAHGGEDALEDVLRRPSAGNL